MDVELRTTVLPSDMRYRDDLRVRTTKKGIYSTVGYSNAAKAYSGYTAV